MGIPPMIGDVHFIDTLQIWLFSRNTYHKDWCYTSYQCFYAIIPMSSPLDILFPMVLNCWWAWSTLSWWEEFRLRNRYSKRFLFHDSCFASDETGEEDYDDTWDAIHRYPLSQSDNPDSRTPTAHVGVTLYRLPFDQSTTQPLSHDSRVSSDEPPRGESPRSFHS